MNTAAKQRLLRAHGAAMTAQRWWNQVTLATDDLQDPELLENTAVTRVMIVRTIERLIELDTDHTSEEVAV